MPQARLDIPVDHPAFAGHFPGRPIVPGVVLLDQAQRVIEASAKVALVGLGVAKFHRPAVPGDELMLDFEVTGEQARFEIRSGEHRVADGRFMVEAGAAS